MTERGIIPGCILHHKNYKFEDGETANKYFVVVGAKPGCNFLSFMATSQKHWREFKVGLRDLRAAIEIQRKKFQAFLPLGDTIAALQKVTTVSADALATITTMETAIAATQTRGRKRSN